MIVYYKTAFGLGTMFRIQGSACYRACFAGLVGVGVFYLIQTFWDGSTTNEKNDQVRHPYAIGVLVAALTFLLVFRANAAYGRYWEACGAVFQMMSKWMDATTHTACYHMQCDHYKGIKPPVFFDYPNLNAHFLTRSREEPHMHHGFNEEIHLSYTDPSRIQTRATQKSINPIKPKEGSVHSDLLQRAMSKRNRKNSSDSMDSSNDGVGTPNRKPTDPIPLSGPPQLDGGWGGLYKDGKTTYLDPNNENPHEILGGFASIRGGRTPALFLQELAHLASLLVAVSFCTLRNDMEDTESPLDFYVPGSKWPPVDPTKLRGANAFENSPWSKFLLFLGMGRSAQELARYNASRPMPVIGGVSEAEIRFLQMARGSYAKTQLCWNWISEFIIREHLAGSTGTVGPPIISRIIQFLGDGMIYYNHARKIMFIPFPFPHAQLSAIYVLVAIPAVAFLMDQYTEDAWVGAVLTFLTVTALSGIQEVARELENPFRNVPNEVPLITLLAQFNEALLTMYAGYHPDHFWRDDGEYYEKLPIPRRQTESMNGTTMQHEPSTLTPPSAMKAHYSHATPKNPGTEVTVEHKCDFRSSLTPIKSVEQIPHEQISDDEPTNGPTSFAEMEAQIQMLMQKVERQETELKRLRARDFCDEKKASSS